MKLLIALLTGLFIPYFAHAAEYKCYSSKYPTDMVHAFADGYVILTVKNRNVKIDYYYVNTVAKETTLEYSATYATGGLKGGNSAVKDLLVSGLKKKHKGFGDDIEPVYFSPSLIENTDFDKKGVIGEFVFSGHGYSWDRNRCFNRSKN